MNTISELYNTVHTAWLEGRLENVLQRQKELAALHGTIKKLAPQLIEELQSELGTSEESVTEEINAVLDNVKHFYEKLDFHESLKKESSIKLGGNVVQNPVALGPTLIDPNPHAPISTTFIPLAAAVSAGSAVIVITAATRSATSKILKNIIEESLDREAVRVTGDDSSQTRRELGSRYFGVAALQNIDKLRSIQADLSQSNGLIRILAPCSGMPVAFIDRSTHDLEVVAAHIQNTVLKTPRHQPLRVPRVFFIDEIIIEDLENFLFSSNRKENALTMEASDENKQLQALLKSKFPSFASKLARGSSNQLLSIISLKKTDPVQVDTIGMVAKMVTAQKEGILLVPIRSLDHGIDIMNKLNEKETSQATYVFGEGKTSFYLGAFSQSLNIFINEIPQRSLVTIVPFSPSASYQLPYSQEDFSVNKSIIQGRIGASEKFKSNKKALQLLTAHKLPLGKLYQPKGGRLSYFERGLIVGLAVTVFVFSGISISINRGVQYYLRWT